MERLTGSSDGRIDCMLQVCHFAHLGFVTFASVMCCGDADKGPLFKSFIELCKMLNFFMSILDKHKVVCSVPCSKISFDYLH